MTRQAENIYIKCKDNGEGISVENDQTEQKYYFAFWRSNSNTTYMNIRERLKYCWYVLRTGKVYSNSITLSRQDVYELYDFLTEQKNRS